jgi:hypothetical protein
MMRVAQSVPPSVVVVTATRFSPSCCCCCCGSPPPALASPLSAASPRAKDGLLLTWKWGFNKELAIQQGFQYGTWNAQAGPKDGRVAAHLEAVRVQQPALRGAAHGSHLAARRRVGPGCLARAADLEHQRGVARVHHHHGGGSE